MLEKSARKHAHVSMKRKEGAGRTSENNWTNNHNFKLQFQALQKVVYKIALVLCITTFVVAKPAGYPNPGEGQPDGNCEKSAGN
jgi:hypothetical protein